MIDGLNGVITTSLICIPADGVTASAVSYGHFVKRGDVPVQLAIGLLASAQYAGDRRRTRREVVINGFTAGFASAR